MKNQALAFFTLLILLATTACSNQWRESDLGMDAADVLDLLNEVEVQSSQSVSDQAAQKFFQIKNNPNSSIYYAEASANGGPLGPLVSVFSVVDYGFMGSELSSLGFMDLSEVRIAYLDLDTETGSDCALMIDVKLLQGGNFVTRFFECESLEIDGGEYRAELRASDGTRIMLRSYDVFDSGELKGVIQMRLSDFDSFGNPQDNGTFSTLVGFGP